MEAGKVIPAGHKLTKIEAVAATCTESGNREYYTCAVCGKIFLDAAGNTEVTELTALYIAATGHKLTRVIEVAATCTETGVAAHYKCSVCGKLFTDAAGTKEVTASALTIPMLSHTWDEGVVTKEPTKRTEGVKTYTCAVCQEKKTENIEQLPAAELVITPNKTTVKQGDKVTFTISFQDAADSGISGVGFTVSAPEGLTYKSFSVRCGDQFAMTNYNKATGRFNGTGTEDIEGVVLDSWDVLTLTYTVDIDAQLEEKSLSVTVEQLYDGDFIDLRCTVENDSVTIAEHDHQWDEGEITKQVTCTEAGSKLCTCGLCGKQQAFEIEALGHSYVYTTKQATCTEKGLKTVSCSNCDYTESEEIPMLEHQWDEGTVTQKPTWKEEGVMTYTCQLGCGTTKTEAIEKLPYQPGNVTGGDENIDLKDVTKIFQYVNGQISDFGDDVNPAAADVTGDGEVDLKDVTRLFQFVNGQIASLDIQ
jgi:uncharacterized repeat protein (TIGR01451 family)